jgi:dihydromonapterin reductase/dihydrofolate reductase
MCRGTAPVIADAIVVTGAGRRVGLHLAERFLERGHPVVAHSHHESEALDHLRRKGALSIVSDLTDATALDLLVQFIAGQVQSLRAIIHNASIFEITSGDRDAAVEQLRRMTAIHATAPFYLNHSLFPLLQACRATHADIVHISDIYADNPNPRFDVYCASKAAGQNLALSFAKKFAPKVKVNVIQPGPILFQQWHTAEARERILAETLLGKEGGAESIGVAAEAILANNFQTGAVVAVDGGRHLA